MRRAACCSRATTRPDAPVQVGRAAQPQSYAKGQRLGAGGENSAAQDGTDDLDRLAQGVNRAGRALTADAAPPGAAEDQQRGRSLTGQFDQHRVVAYRQPGVQEDQ